MFTSDEIARHAGAAWALFKGDRQGIREFDVSVEGFWRSFGVIVLLLPAIGILVAAQRSMLLTSSAYSLDTFPTAAFLWSRVVAYGIGWVDYPLALALLARPLGIGKRFVPLVVALNWSSLIAAIPVTLPSLLYILGLLGQDGYDFLNLVAFGLVLRYQYVVTRAATAAPPVFAFGLVVLDTLLGFAAEASVLAISGI
jgi:hypothetical protein